MTTESYSYAGITDELVQSRFGTETTTELTTVTTSYAHAKVPLAHRRTDTRNRSA